MTPEQKAADYSRSIEVDYHKEKFNLVINAYYAGYSQCQEENKDEYRWTYSEIFDACFPTLGRGGDWAAIAKRLIEQKENKQD